MKEDTCSSKWNGKVTKIDHIVGHKENLNYTNNCTNFEDWNHSDHSGIKLKIKNKR